MTDLRTRLIELREKDDFFALATLLTDNLDTIIAALQPSGETGWQPIETAPKDGTEVLVWRPDEGDGEHFAHAGNDKWKGFSWWRSRRFQQPTHWMPLPPAPLPSSKREG